MFVKNGPGAVQYTTRAAVSVALRGVWASQCPTLGLDFPIHPMAATTGQSWHTIGPLSGSAAVPEALPCRNVGGGAPGPAWLPASPSPRPFPPWLCPFLLREGAPAGHLALFALLCVKFFLTRTPKACGLQLIFENKQKKMLTAESGQD